MWRRGVKRAAMTARLDKLQSGQIIPFGGDRAAQVSDALAAAFKAGDRLIVVQESGDLLHVPAATHDLAAAAVTRAKAAFDALAEVSDEAITAFFEAFARRLEDDAVWGTIAAANAADVERALGRGRSTTRLAASEAMRASMIEGLRMWRDIAPARARRIEHIDHGGWTVEQVTAPLGVVGFVFEGRPNVFADATGVLRSGNTVVFRIGSDALGTARAIVAEALDPALAEAGLPEGAATLIDSAEHAAGWAMFSDRRLALAVARGSGAAVAQLGAVARQAGVSVSLHGTGGAWMVADHSAVFEPFAEFVENSLDRKVCNTLNVCAVVRMQADYLIPELLAGLTRAGARRGRAAILHVVRRGKYDVDFKSLERQIKLVEAEGPRVRLHQESLREDDLGREWEWEDAPEISLVMVENVEDAVALFNRYSPQFVASLISQDAAAHETFYRAVNAPFVGDGFTRWVDGQYALNKPELGLSNWEAGRTFARAGVLSGDGVFTVRTRVRQSDPKVRR
jgi:glutamate-5-semialdehyde dehydrogenase